MAKLTRNQRNKLGKKQFALPNKRAFPIENKEHARKALQLAPRSLKKGHISLFEYHRIIHKAKMKLHPDNT